MNRMNRTGRPCQPWPPGTLLLAAALALLHWTCPVSVDAGRPSLHGDVFNISQLKEGAVRGNGTNQSFPDSATPPVIRLDVARTSSSKGPKALGINMGHRYPGSNWKLFFSRLRPSVARVFMDTAWTSKYSWTNGSSSWGIDLEGGAVSTLREYQAAVDMQRSADGRNTTYPWPNATAWDKYEKAFSANRTFLGNFNNTMYELKSMGVDPLVVIATTCNTFSFTSMDTRNGTYWAERWELYRHVYVLAAWCHKRGVHLFEVYNEPLQDWCLQEQGLDAFLQHYYLRATAIRDAYEDLNAGSSSPLQPFILVSAFAKGTYGGDNDTWSSAAVLNRHARFPASTIASNSASSSWSNMDGYSYHSYDKSGSSMLAQFSSVTSAVHADWPKAGPIWVTEHNAHTGANWAKSQTTTDSAKEAAMSAGQTISIASAGGNMILFKFSVTPSSTGVAKNGVHWADSSAAPYHVADASLTAEAARLVNTHLAAGPKDLLDLRASPVDADKAYLAVREGSVYYMVMSSGRTQSAAVVVVNVSAWNISPGTKVVVQEVSSTSWGEVSSILTVDKFGAVNYTLPCSAVALLAFPTGKQSSLRVSAAATATVAAGDLSDRTIREASSAGESSSLGVMLCGTSSGPYQESTFVTLLRFSIPRVAGSPGGSVDMSQLTSAVLELSVGTSVGGSPGVNSNMVLSVLAMRDATWTEENATWQSTQALNPLPNPSTINSTASNFINWDAVWAVAGHISVPVGADGGLVRRLDVTDLVRTIAKQGPGSLSLLLYRPFRVDPVPAQLIPGDDLSGGCVLEFSRKLAAQPQLVLFSN